MRMLSNRRSRAPFLAVLAALPLAGGCPKPPMMTTLPAPTFMVHDQAELTQDGMTIAIAPITETSQKRFPQVYKTFDVMVESQDTMGKVVQVPGRVAGAVVPLPAFQVRIANNTGHVVRFTTAVIRLQDNTGKSYPTFASKDELLSWVDAGVAETGGSPQLAEQIHGAVNNLQLLGRNIELLKGDEWSGYLAFNLDTPTAGKLRAFMNATERLTLRIAEVPTETDDAGAVTKTTEFTFNLDKTTEDIDAQCPGETTEPSWEVCTAVQ